MADFQFQAGDVVRLRDVQKDGYTRPRVSGVSLTVSNVLPPGSDGTLLEFDGLTGGWFDWRFELVERPAPKQPEQPDQIAVGDVVRLKGIHGPEMLVTYVVAADDEEDDDARVTCVWFDGQFRRYSIRPWLLVRVSS